MIYVYISSTFVGGIAYLALALFVYSKVPQRASEVKLFLLVCLGWSIYNIALMLQFIMFHENFASRELVLICMNVSNTVGAFVVVMYVDFLLTFANRRPKWYWCIYGIEAAITPIFIWHEWVNDLLPILPDGQVLQGDIKANYTHYYPPNFPVAPLLTFFFFVIVAWGLISLRKACHNTDSPIRRKMLRFLFWVSFLIFPAAVSDMAFMLRNVGIFPFSTLVGLGYVVYFSYVIVRYRFLGVRIAIGKGIIYIALTALITTFFFAVVAMNPLDSIPLVILLALGAAIIFYLIRERLEVFIDRVMFRKSYQYQRSLEQLDRDIMNELDPARFVEKLAVWLEESLKLKHVDVFLLETHIGKEKQYFTTVGSGRKIKNKRIPGDSLLVKCLKEKQETIFRADLPVLPQFRDICQELDEEFRKLSAEVCVPLATDRLLFGIDLGFQNDLNSGSVSEELHQEFEGNRILLSHNTTCSIEERNRKWVMSDKNNIQTYTIRKEADKLNVYTGSKLSGIIVCGNRRYGRFEEEDRRLLGIAAYNIAFAVERAQLILELKSANYFKWELVRWLSHDLNTPLTPIKMIVNALGRKVSNSPEDQQAISVVMCEITRLQSLINGLDFIADLDVVSSRTHIRHELMDLGSLIEEVVSLFEWQAKENGITLSCRIPADISPIRGDADRMKQALVNLISNSIKYNRPGGKVEITALQTDDNVVANIADTGIGVSETEEVAIFEPFYRSDKAQTTGKGGVGLGLAIVKRIVEEHGGTIQVQSELDAGTSMRLTIPCEPRDGRKQELIAGDKPWKQEEAS